MTTPTYKTTFVERTRRRMSELDHSLPELAVRAGLTRQNLREMLSPETRRITVLASLNRLAAALEVRPSYLVGETDALEPCLLDTTTSFAERLRARRLELGLTPADLSERTRISRPAVHDLEALPRRSPRVTTVGRLATGLETSFAYLAGELDAPRPEPSRLIHRRVPESLIAAADRLAIPFSSVLSLAAYAEGVDTRAGSRYRSRSLREWAQLWRELDGLLSQSDAAAPARRDGPRGPLLPEHLIDVSDALGLPFSEVLALAVYADAIDSRSGRLDVDRAPRAWQSAWRRVYGVPAPEEGARRPRD